MERPTYLKLTDIYVFDASFYNNYTLKTIYLTITLHHG